uniref:Uncharacterized protein n=1 Tax=Rhizophora mucronata TaxID=61149 RepID=A0A2P2P5L6_RHIMU
MPELTLCFSTDYMNQTKPITSFDIQGTLTFHMIIEYNQSNFQSLTALTSYT